jgi:hypothetical protein
MTTKGKPMAAKAKAKTKKAPTLSGLNVINFFGVLNTEADKLEVNTLPEVGVKTTQKLDAIAAFAMTTYPDFGISTDNLPYTPKFERLIKTINSRFRVHMGGWHVWKILVKARKDNLLPRSGTSRKSGTIIKKR